MQGGSRRRHRSARPPWWVMIAHPQTLPVSQAGHERRPALGLLRCASPSPPRPSRRAVLGHVEGGSAARKPVRPECKSISAQQGTLPGTWANCVVSRTLVVGGSGQWCLAGAATFPGRACGCTRGVAGYVTEWRRVWVSHVVPIQSPHTDFPSRCVLGMPHLDALPACLPHIDATYAQEPPRMASLPPPKREGGPRAGWHSWAVFALGTSGAAQDWGTPARPAVPAPAPDERIDRRLFTPSPGGRTSAATPWRLDATPPVPAQLDPSSSE